MNARYLKAAKSIGEAASFFALRAYQVDTTFCRNHIDMEVTVYFYHGDEKKLIEGDLRRYADDDDNIIYRTHTLPNGSEFYTLTLKKYTS